MNVPRGCTRVHVRIPLTLAAGEDSPRVMARLSQFVIEAIGTERDRLN
jgi:hypothetical protein